MRIWRLMVPVLAALIASCGNPDLKVSQETTASVTATPTSRCDTLDEVPAQSDPCSAKTMAGQRRSHF
jgi:hypothetical protein